MDNVAKHNVYVLKVEQEMEGEVTATDWII